MQKIGKRSLNDHFEFKTRIVGDRDGRIMPKRGIDDPDASLELAQSGFGQGSTSPQSTLPTLLSFSFLYSGLFSLFCSTNTRCKFILFPPPAPPDSHFNPVQSLHPSLT
jgi:hypothetical protein